MGNTPQTELFSLKPYFSVAPPRSRQQLSFGDIETTTEFLLHCTHRLSASTFNLFLWLQTWRLLFPTAVGSEGPSPGSWMSALLSHLSSHCPGPQGWFYTWHPPGVHLVTPSFIRVSDTMWAKIPSPAGVFWGFDGVEVTGWNENCRLCSATRDSSLRKLWCAKTSVYRTIIVLNVFRNRNRKCKRVLLSSPWQTGNGKFHLFRNQNILPTYAEIFVNVTTTNKGK